MITPEEVARPGVDDLLLESFEFGSGFFASEKVVGRVPLPLDDCCGAEGGEEGSEAVFISGDSEGARFSSITISGGELGLSG